MTVEGRIELATSLIEEIAEDDSYGYSQVNRWGPDYDCSSLVIQCWQNAGVPVKQMGATYTGDMYSVFLKCGFRDVTHQITLSSGDGLQRGDVLLNVSSHTAMSVGDGKIAHARSSEGNSDEGDANGREIVTGQSYWNYPWDYVLRFTEDVYGNNVVIQETAVANEQTPCDTDTKFNYINLQNGSGLNCPMAIVKVLQLLLSLQGFNTDADGEFGPNTETQVKRYQRWRRLEENGIVDEDDWEALIQFQE